MSPTAESPSAEAQMRVCVVATFEDFDETLERRQRGPGSGRKHCAQALIRHLSSLEGVQYDLLVLDWKSPPKAGPNPVTVNLGASAEGQGSWGSREQLEPKFCGLKWDIVICTQSRRMVLDFAVQLSGRRHLVMGHDYNLPFGPWGIEQADEQLKEHYKLCRSFHWLCPSQHLADYISHWSDGECKSSVCYAADYGFFSPTPEAPMSPWEGVHSVVTFLSPCPQKGLCIFVRLAKMFPERQFLAVSTVAWTKSYNEQMLKRIPNVRVRTGTEDMDEIFRQTKVLIIPSIGQESFSLVAIEAQLRGIPVVSIDTCGLSEANLVPDCIVPGVQLVYDQRTKEIIVGMTQAEADTSLAVNRPGALTLEQARQSAIQQESNQRVAEESEVEGFAAFLTNLLDDEETLKKVSEEARAAAMAFVEKRDGKFVGQLQELLDNSSEAPPLPKAKAKALKNSAPRVMRDFEEEEDFDCNQDFTKMEDFDGQKLAARLLVRLAEQGSITILAELISAKADVNAPEPDVGVPPLIAACNAGHIDVVKYLIRKEADVHQLCADGTSRTALHAACEKGFTTVVNVLMEQKVDLKAKDMNENTPLHLAVRNGHGGATDSLLKAGVNPNITDDQGQVPINDAVAKDRFDLVSMLLEKGALVNVRNMAGLEAISFVRTPTMQRLIMKNDINFGA